MCKWQAAKDGQEAWDPQRATQPLAADPAGIRQMWSLVSSCDEASGEWGTGCPGPLARAAQSHPTVGPPADGLPLGFLRTVFLLNVIFLCLSK